MPYLPGMPKPANTDRRHPPRMTPWGAHDSCTETSDGLFQVSTPSHGGYWVRHDLLMQMPPTLRKIGEGQWFEEDCAWAAVVFHFHDRFSSDQVKTARDCLIDWFPHQYMQVTETTIPTKQSYVLRQEEFKRVNAQRYVVTAAWGDWHPKVPKGMVGVVAKLGEDRSSKDERWVLVPSEQYKIPYVLRGDEQGWTDHP